MRNYELFLLLKPQKDEATAQRTLREIETVLNRYGGKFLRIGSGGNMRTAYPIQNRRDAYQVIVEIEAETKDVAEMRKQLGLLEDIIRLELFALV